MTIKCLGLWFLGAMFTFFVGCSADTASGPSNAPEVVEAGWSFGFCLGGCRGTLAVSDTSLVYTISSRSGDEVLFRQRGNLTSTGVARLDTLSAALPETLSERYGCPDCADGGAAYFVIEVDSASRRVEYEYGSPPPELSALDSYLKAVMEALSNCQSNGNVVPESGCTPYTP